MCRFIELNINNVLNECTTRTHARIHARSRMLCCRKILESTKKWMVYDIVQLERSYVSVSTTVWVLRDLLIDSGLIKGLGFCNNVIESCNLEALEKGLSMKVFFLNFYKLIWKLWKTTQKNQFNWSTISHDDVWKLTIAKLKNITQQN